MRAASGSGDFDARESARIDMAIGVFSAYASRMRLVRMTSLTAAAVALPLLACSASHARSATPSTTVIADDECEHAATNTARLAATFMHETTRGRVEIAPIVERQCRAEAWDTALQHCVATAPDVPSWRRCTRR